MHNGNLTNSEEFKEKLFNLARRHVNTNSDSEILLNILAYHLDKTKLYIYPQKIFLMQLKPHIEILGGYACIAMIIGQGMVAFRDPHGIRPLVLGKRVDENGFTEYMFASESVALDIVGFEMVRDVLPGEAIYVTFDGQLFARNVQIILYFHLAFSNMSILLDQILTLMVYLFMLLVFTWENDWVRRLLVNGKI